jgi:hypothetical protein
MTSAFFLTLFIDLKDLVAAFCFGVLSDSSEQTHAALAHRSRETQILRKQQHKGQSNVLDLFGSSYYFVGNNVWEENL